MTETLETPAIDLSGLNNSYEIIGELAVDRDAQWVVPALA